MRKTITMLLAATALAGAAAQTANADIPNPVVTGSSTATSVTQGCVAPFDVGVKGQYGAWGNYVDGCTAKVRCPFAYCQVQPGSGGDVYSWTNFRKTCNSRVRGYSVSGAVSWYRDYSGVTDGWDCEAKDRDGQIVRNGELVTVQSNGVANYGYWNGYDTSAVASKVTLTWYSGGLRPPS